MEQKLAIAFLVFFFLSCGGNSPTGTSNADYAAQLNALITEEASIISTYESVTGVNYTNDTELRRVLSSQAIPMARTFIAKIEAITPPSNLRPIHEKYISAWNLQYDAFVLVVTAIDQSNGALVVQANEKLTEARRLVREVIASLENA